MIIISVAHAQITTYSRSILTPEVAEVFHQYGSILIRHPEQPSPPACETSVNSLQCDEYI